jgi:hypothetical protein
MAHACNPRELRVKARLGNILQDPISKITRAKSTRGYNQVVGHLICNRQALSSNPTFPVPQKRNKICCGNWFPSLRF